MLLKDIIDQTGFLLNFNEQANQDFSSVRLKQLINMAYRLEVQLARQEGSRDYFIAGPIDFTWPASQVTLILPDTLKSAQILHVNDVTTQDPGFVLNIGSYESGALIWPKDVNTLQWGQTGPTSAISCRAFYLATPEDLKSDDQSPMWVPPQYHDLISWSAAILGRSAADEQAPGAWMELRQELRMSYWKHVARGRFMTNPQWGASNARPDGIGDVVTNNYFNQDNNT